jgi:hypothetical protein
MPYAADTEVPVERSRGEIEATLDRYGATSYVYARQGDKVLIIFEIADRRYRVALQLPVWDEYRQRPPLSRPHKKSLTAREQYELEVRRRWRSLALWIRATLVAVEDGIVTLQQAMQAFVVLPAGNTVGEWLEPQIGRVYATGQMPPMLPMLKKPGESDVIDP